MYLKKTDPTPKPMPASMTVAFADVGLSGSVEVTDIWQKKSLGVFQDRFTQEVPSHGTAFLRLKAQ